MQLSKFEGEIAIYEKIIGHFPPILIVGISMEAQFWLKMSLRVTTEKKNPQIEQIRSKLDLEIGAPNDQIRA